MKRKIRSALLTLLITASVIIPAYSQDAVSILANMDNVMFSPKDMTGKMKVIMVDKNGKQEIREAMVQQKGTDMRIFRFISPASQAGIAFLSLPDDIMYMYLPAYGKERRIATSAKNQNFAGTDFSYDDMESRSYNEKYTPVLLKTETASFVLELTPKNASDYSKIIVTINKQDYYPEYMEFYDRGQNKVKTAEYTFTRTGKYWNASEVEMTNLRSNRKTTMQMSDVKYDTGLTDDDFSVRKLKQ